MSNAKKTDGAPTIKLLKRTKVSNKDGKEHVFHNIFIQINDGYPVAIDLPQSVYPDNAKRYRLRSLLLAIASEYEVAFITKPDADKNEKDF